MTTEEQIENFKEEIKTFDVPELRRAYRFYGLSPNNEQARLMCEAIKSELSLRGETI